MQATAQVRRRLAELELDMDRQQGWVRGGSKSEVSLLPGLSIQRPPCPHANPSTARRHRTMRPCVQTQCWS